MMVGSDMNTKYKKNLLLAFVCALFSVQASAAIIDNGWYTVDTESGLSWLDLTDSRIYEQPYDDVVAETLPGGALDGWRYASVLELTQLLDHWGVVSADNIDFMDSGGPRWQTGSINTVLTSDVVNTLGDTYLIYRNDVYASYGPWTTDEPGQALMILGYLGDSSNENPGEAYVGRIIDRDYTNNLGTFTNHDDIDLSYVDRPTWLGIEGGSSFLVRNALVSEVPIPAAGYLFISALAGLLARKRIERKRLTRR